MHAVSMISTCTISVMVDQKWKISPIFNCIRNILFTCKFSDCAAGCLDVLVCLNCQHQAAVSSLHIDLPHTLNTPNYCILHAGMREHLCTVHIKV